VFQSVAADEMTEREDWHVQKFESLSHSLESHRDEKIGASRISSWEQSQQQRNRHDRVELNQAVKSQVTLPLQLR